MTIVCGQIGWHFVTNLSMSVNFFDHTNKQKSISELIEPNDDSYSMTKALNNTNTDSKTKNSE